PLEDLDGLHRVEAEVEEADVRLRGRRELELLGEEPLEVRGEDLCSPLAGGSAAERIEQRGRRGARRRLRGARSSRRDAGREEAVHDLVRVPDVALDELEAEEAPD